MSPASEPPGFLSSLSRRFLPSFFNMGRPVSAPVNVNDIASDIPPPAVTHASRAMVPATMPHPRAVALHVPVRAASPTRAPVMPSAHSLFQEHPYSGPVPASPEVTVLSQPPIMVNSHGQTYSAAVSRPASAAAVYQTDGYGRIVPVGSVNSAVDYNVFPMQVFPAVQGVVPTVPGVPGMHHSSSMEISAAQVQQPVASPVVREVSTIPVQPAQSYQSAGPLESFSQLPACLLYTSDAADE